MSRSFIRVDELIAESNERVENIRLRESLENVTDVGGLRPVYWDGIPVNPRLEALIRKLLSTYKNYKVGITVDSKKSWGINGCSIYSEVWVYVPNERYARGRIGYGAFFATKEGNTYMVFNHTIMNGKYTTEKQHYHMMLAGKEDTALKNAYKHLKPHTIIDIASRERDSFLWGMRNVLDSKSSEMNSIYDNKLKQNMFIELRHALNSGHKFASEDYKQALAQYFEKQDEFNKYKNKPRPAYYVWIKPEKDGEEQTADILECDASIGFGYKAGNVVTLKMSDIPVDIAGKIAVLSMVNDKHYVENVGSKVSSDAYWIERE